MLYKIWTIANIITHKEAKMFDLYILDSCPYCQKVMKYIDSKGIKYHKFDTKNKDNVLRLLSIGGKDQVPFLHDEDNDEKIYESDKIIEYIEKLNG